MKRQKPLAKKAIARTPQKKTHEKPTTSQAITKKLEAELLKAHDTYWTCYLKGDVKTMATLLADGYSQVGSAETEVFFNKREAVKFLRDTIKQVAGKVDMRKRVTKLEVHGDLILIHELCDLYGKSDKQWVFYSKFRASTWLKEINKSWKIIHQHSSFPDARTDDGENLAIEKIEAENQQLREAVKRRTVELEHKTIELEIEAALERVRATSMAMHKSEALVDVVRILDKEIIGLGIDIHSSQIVTDFANPEEGLNDWLAIEGYEFLEKFHVPYIKHPITEKWIRAVQEGTGFYTEIYTKTEKNKYFRQVFKSSDFKKISKEGQERSLNAPVLIRAVVLSKNSILVFHRFSRKEFTKAEEDIFKRLGKVFEQAYVRFLDLQKAEAQAREAQIEVSLERVRARAMAMHKSEELSEAAILLYKELRSLGIGQYMNCGYVLIDEKNNEQHGWLSTFEGAQMDKFTLPLTGELAFNQRYENWKKNVPVFLQKLGGAKLKKHVEFAMPHLGSKQVEEIVRTQFPDPTIFYCFNFSSGYLHIITDTQLTPESEALSIRFTKVFEHTYKRFLDLQKAEAQAREAQIEAGLERVRSKTMAMHNSHDVGNTVVALFDELVELGLEKSARCGVGILDESNSMELWSASINNKKEMVFAIGTLNMTLHPLLEGVKQAWSSKKQSFSYELQGEDLISYYNTLNDAPDYTFYVDIKTLPEKIIQNSFSFTDGVIFSFTSNPISENFANVFKRFAAVFGQTYKRYLDLQKAEAQAREAQIEVSLERVRTRAMSMHKSDELGEAAELLNKELQKLGVTDFINCGFVEIDEQNKTQHGWITNTEGKAMERFYLPLVGDPVLDNRYEAWRRKDSVFCQALSGEMLKEHVQFVNPQLDSEEAIQNSNNFPDPTIFYCGNFSHGYLCIITGTPFTVEKEALLARFTRVFELTYKRFLDLKQAEAQAREAQIEASMERVRSRTMAMHKSEELGEVAVLLYRELKELGVTQHYFECGYVEIDELNKIQHAWTTGPDGKLIEPFNLPLSGEPIFDARYEAWKQRVPVFHQVVGGEQLQRHNEFAIPYLGSKEVEEITRTQVPDSVIFYCGNFSHGYLSIMCGELLSAEAEVLLARFTRVFEMTYKRFLDLQKAEAQTREAQIEAALERVRSRSMAMQHSDELNEVLSAMFGELSSLGLALARCVIWTFNIEDRSARWWSANPESESGTESFLIPYTDHPTCIEYWKSWEERRNRYFYDLSGEIKKTWDDYLFNHTEMARLPEPVKAAMMAPQQVFLYNSFRDFGVLFAVGHEPISEENFDIVERFGKVFDQSYTRFKDIQLAELREKEAVRQASLDRVRAEIASMRTTNDLERITPLIWKELTTLGIPFIRCGVFIMDEIGEQTHTFLSTPEGKAIAAFHLPYRTANLEEAVHHWRKKKSYVTHWGKTEFSVLADALMKQGAISTREQYLNTLPEEGIHLHFLPFLQGMLYVGNTTALKEDDIKLVQSVADAFSTAYARYEDFNKLEAAKQKVDKTLVDLKQTQQQLVQSEKMASLGELTAGIAHEIQNPLNFVNNFSEVSTELVDEMNEELQKGNTEDAKSIAADLKLNLEKINHHGKRAGDIVKGMLQHSRSSSGVKEPTNINALADEYLRLAYHGLRAKDKTFNATLKTEFDESIGTVNIIPQDIGRVILNLITNAFYVVNEKAKLQASDYEPQVVVSTKRLDTKIEISVKDNGNGIPDSIKEKIFHPFFTTKPTGQGTGLGLSLSYDIVKAHGGKLIVETREGKGSNFIIELSIA